MPNQDSENRTQQAPDVRQPDIWQPVDGPPSDHGKAAKVMRKIANLSQKSDGIINDLCDGMKDAMEADSKEEGVDIVKSAFDITALSQTEVLHSSRLFFILRNVMRILGFAVRGGKTIIPHVMNLLFEPGCPELEEALAMYRNYRNLVSPTAQPAERVFREQDPQDTGSEPGVLQNTTPSTLPASETRPRNMPPLNIGHKSPVQKFSPRAQPRPEGLNFRGAEASSSPPSDPSHFNNTAFHPKSIGPRPPQAEILQNFRRLETNSMPPCSSRTCPSFQAHPTLEQTSLLPRTCSWPRSGNIV
ncbi:unnamed protein product [Chondrus crispus]|uniref:Uncharacterized protein n=1 Tax=Chondrus crispus TaxID=2769 RepID=R7QHF0_CHOCR|nr:unnamed protein product [Chondrus crispus]CDF36855.1 unnamed protein product [Chondrus crispus]|eukprot:XP_005716674.1 unnamed protein product [Chondrus crispus]